MPHMWGNSGDLFTNVTQPTKKERNKTTLKYYLNHTREHFNNRLSLRLIGYDAHRISIVCIIIKFTCYTRCHMASKKAVLVQLSSFNRKVEFEVPPEGMNKTEREVLLEQIRNSYRERINVEDSITLQVKDKEWGGEFVDDFSDSIPDRSVVRVLVERKKVCN